MNQQDHTKLTLITIGILILSAVIIAFLALTTGKEPQQESIVMEETSQEISLVEESSQKTIELETLDMNQALDDFSYDNQKSIDQLKALGQHLYGDDYLSHQKEILQVLNDNDMLVLNFGYAFLPEQPAQYTETAGSAKQIDVPLMLQSDPEWSRTPYGTSQGDTMRLGGCALVSLAMVEATLGNPDTTPLDILDWSKNDYWVGEDGTSWSIFSDFAKEYGYQFTDHGNELYDALDEIEQGNIVIASVNPGYITDVGHILVIRGYDPENNLVYVNDPNDNPNTMFSIQGLPDYYFLEDAINYWSFKK